MEIATVVLCILLLSLYILVALAWLFIAISTAVRDHKQAKKNAAWEEEKQKLEKEHALRDVEYHQARMKELNK